ncbi:hypothetical protein VCA_003080 [Vibrio albensis VL426]|nr:hypothetical protein VCA_003080 [Vibrio cholerae VL426]
MLAHVATECGDSANQCDGGEELRQVTCGLLI